MMATALKGLFQPTQSHLQNVSATFVRWGSAWRDSTSYREVWPNYKFHRSHKKHYVLPHTIGLQAQSKVRVVDNSKIGREAMASGKPPKIIQVYSRLHDHKPHGAYAVLGDRVKVAILGLKKEGIIVGLRAKQVPGVPKFDTNNIVLIKEDGSPLGTRIHVPIPNCIRQKLKDKSHPKGADYTKIMAIATRFV